MIQERSKAEIDAAKKATGWANTEEGRLAKRFSDIGGLKVAAACDASLGKVEVIEGTKYCVLKKRDFFGGDDTRNGWKIP